MKTQKNNPADTRRRPRVLHVDFSAYGVMTHVLSIIDNADASQWEHCVIYAVDDQRPGVDRYREELKRRGIEGWEVPVRQHLTPGDAIALARTSALVGKIKPDLIHCHS